jgi:hypothetical protein
VVPALVEQKSREGTAQKGEQRADIREQGADSTQQNAHLSPSLGVMKWNGRKRATFVLGFFAGVGITTMV